MYTARKKISAFRNRKQRRNWWDNLYTSSGKLLRHKQPPHGWIHEARFCLFMSFSDIAARLGKSRSCIAHYERDEISGGISLRTLKAVAETMNCDFAYYFIPKNSHSFEAILSEQRKKHQEPVNFAQQNFWKPRNTT